MVCKISNPVNFYENWLVKVESSPNNVQGLVKCLLWGGLYHQPEPVCHMGRPVVPHTPNEITSLRVVPQGADRRSHNDPLNSLYV